MISWTGLLAGHARYGVEEHSHNRAPSVVVWNATRRCNLSCRHCYFDSSGVRDSRELSTLDAKAFIEDIAKLGVSTLIFSGGEPLLRSDIFELARFAKDKGIRPTLSTNGTLITGEMARKIKEAGFLYVGISLDGMQETNDRFRKSEGAFERAVKGIRNCQGIGLKVGLRFTLQKYNSKDLPHLFDMVEREDIRRFCIYHLVYTGRGDGLKAQDLTNEERREAMELIFNKALEFRRKKLNIEILTVDNHTDGAWLYLRLKKENPRGAEEVLRLLKMQGGNRSGIGIGAVDDLGNIYPDQFWRTHHLGNVRKTTFSEVWQDGRNEFLRDLRNRKSLLKGRCQRCLFLVICNGNFRARAEAIFGDPWAEDPACYLTEEEISEKWN